jgi:hypothetical protein
MNDRNTRHIPLQKELSEAINKNEEEKKENHELEHSPTIVQR